MSKLDDWARIGDHIFSLTSNEFADGKIAPKGYRQIEFFQLDHGVPTWTFALAVALLEKRVWMPPGQGVAMATYSLRPTSRPVRFTIRAYISGRDAHGQTCAGGGGPAPSVTAAGAAAHFRAEAHEFHVTVNFGAFTATRRWVN